MNIHLNFKRPQSYFNHGTLCLYGKEQRGFSVQLPPDQVKWPTLFPSGDVTGLNFWTVCPGFFRVREYENLAKQEVLTKKYEAHKRGKNARKHEKSKMKHQESNNIIQTIFLGYVL